MQRIWIPKRGLVVYGPLIMSTLNSPKVLALMLLPRMVPSLLIPINRRNLSLSNYLSLFLPHSQLSLSLSLSLSRPNFIIISKRKGEVPMAANTNPSPKPSACLQDMDEVTKVFKKFDANGDGKISVTELVDVMKALGSDTSEAEINRTMEEIDSDRDGFISLDESGAQELRDAFELYDQDNNGLISAAELHQILSRLGEKCSVHDCTGMINSVDSDGDGYVSFEEFKKMIAGAAAAAAGTTSGSST